MRRDQRAIIFDLDDTLYPLDWFVLSGFDAVGAHLQHLFGVDAAMCRTVLRRAFNSGNRGHELQTCLRHFNLPVALAASLVQVIRTHQPVIDLPALTVKTLGTLTPGWRIGIVTNGSAEIQARKVAALGLGARVDAVVFADGVATPEKPAAAPFLEMSRRLGVPPCRSVFVGNDPTRDVFGAWRLGMKTIHVAGLPATPSRAPIADASVCTLLEVPEIAERLVA